MSAHGTGLADRLDRTHDDANYLRRMARAGGDKARLIDLADTTGLVVDVGCADGMWMHAARTAGAHVVGIEPAPALVSRCRAAGLDVRQGDASQVHELVGTAAAATVVASSVLHEVFSYGNHNGTPGDLASVHEAFASFAAALRPGGRLLVRDGVMPDDPTAREVIDVADRHAYRFLQHSPFTEPGGQRVLDLLRVSKDVWEGDRASVMELALTLNWGPGSFAREVAEWYGVDTLAGYPLLAAQHGLELVWAEAYTQAAYVPGVAKYVGFRSGWFPHTNAVWAYRRA